MTCNIVFLFSCFRSGFRIGEQNGVDRRRWKPRDSGWASTITRQIWGNILIKLCGYFRLAFTNTPVGWSLLLCRRNVAGPALGLPGDPWLTPPGLLNALPGFLAAPHTGYPSYLTSPRRLPSPPNVATVANTVPGSRLETITIWLQNFSFGRGKESKSETIVLVNRNPNRRDDEYRKRWSRSRSASQSSRTRPTHNQHPGSENASQGTRWKHYQRVANGLKFNVQEWKARNRVRACRSRAFNTAGVTGSKTTLPSTLQPRRMSSRSQTDRQTRSIVPFSSWWTNRRFDFPWNRLLVIERVPRSSMRKGRLTHVRDGSRW